MKQTIIYSLITLCILQRCVLCLADGSRFIGLGYNILLGNPDGGDLSLTGVDPGLKSTRHVLKLTSNSAGKLIDSDNKAYCTTHNSAAVFFGGKSYQNYLLGDIVTFGPGDGSVLPYAFSASRVFKDIKHRTNDNHDVLRDTETVCNKGRTRYVLPPMYPDLHKVTDEFASAVCHLPVQYNQAIYRQFLDVWGTHVVVGVDIGTKTVNRYEQSVSQIAEILQSYDTEIGSVSVEDFMGYGTVYTLYISKLSHSDIYTIKGGNLDGTLSIGTIDNPEPLAYKMGTIANFIQDAFWNNSTTFFSNGICSEIDGLNLPQRQANVVKVMGEYPILNGLTSKPLDPVIKIPVTWPHGTYGLYHPKSGCPTAAFTWEEGWNRQDAEDSRNADGWSPTIHLDDSVKTSGKPIFHFCIKTINENKDYERDWPKGNYCILKKGDCPQGFNSGSIKWDDEDHDNANSHAGTLPDGSYGGDTVMFFCCRKDGNYQTSILLPVDRPFYLLKYTSHCQEVFGMTVSEEYYKMDTEDHHNTDAVSGSHPNIINLHHDPIMYFCYYERKNNFPARIFGR
ncbi:Hypothetical predicted protein [Mytilus galloprovincialis]|uniref:MACPF domain-containing protein n=1 Tax=Mytilus galloprovincialis TaxID=29158 RepID=A0A8B6FI70_MYTGA|nr:Hypothetical predicted protein [Mytilus galloprovincialis]